MSWIATAEKALTTEQARALTLAIRDKLTDLLPLIKQAYEGRADQALGYATWHDYCMAELSGLRIPLTDRPAAVAELRQNGMSTRAIGSALGVTHTQVQRDLNQLERDVPVAQPEKVVSLDGRERPATMPAREAVAETATEPVEALQYRCFGCSHIWPRTDKGNTCPKCGGWGIQHQERKPKDDTALPAGQEHADAALAAIDESVQHQASAPPRIEPPDPEVRERLAREREEQNSREAISRDLARCVWLLAEFGRVVDAPDKAVREWQPSQDIYPAKTTAARLRQAADYLYALAERWPQ